MAERLVRQKLILNGTVVEGDGETVALLVRERAEPAAGLMDRDVQHVCPFQKR